MLDVLSAAILAANDSEPAATPLWLSYLFNGVLGLLVAGSAAKVWLTDRLNKADVEQRRKTVDRRIGRTRREVRQVKAETEQGVRELRGELEDVRKQNRRFRRRIRLKTEENKDLAGRLTDVENSLKQSQTQVETYEQRYLKAKLEFETERAADREAIAALTRKVDSLQRQLTAAVEENTALRSAKDAKAYAKLVDDNTSLSAENFALKKELEDLRQTITDAKA